MSEILNEMKLKEFKNELNNPITEQFQTPEARNIWE